MMKKTFNKTICLLIIIGLNWLGLFAIGQTFAYYNDTETSTGNTYAAGSLDFSLNSAGNFSPTLIPNQNSNRTINVVNEGSLKFQYNIELNVVSLNTDLCDNLNLELSLNNTSVYSGSLMDFDAATSALATSTIDTLDFEASINSEEYFFWNKTCDFDIIVNARQNDFIDYGQGFFDTEKIHNRVISGSWGVVLNEFLPNPDGLDDAPMTGGEWVELYNNNDFDVDVNGWVIYDEIDTHELYVTSRNTNTGDTIVPANGWLVVYRDGDSDFNLNNDADSVRLYDGYPVASSNLIDEYTYTQEKEEGYSYARLPDDGTGEWVDPVPTPGGPNSLEPIDAMNTPSGDGSADSDVENENPANTAGGQELGEEKSSTDDNASNPSANDDASTEITEPIDEGSDSHEEVLACQYSNLSDTEEVDGGNDLDSTDAPADSDADNSEEVSETITADEELSCNIEDNDQLEDNQENDEEDTAVQEDETLTEDNSDNNVDVDESDDKSWESGEEIEQVEEETEDDETIESDDVEADEEVEEDLINDNNESQDEELDNIENNNEDTDETEPELEPEPELESEPQAVIESELAPEPEIAEPEPEISINENNEN